MRNDISNLPCIRNDEITKLRDAKINTIDDVWERVGADFNHGIVLAAQEFGLDPQRLMDLLAGAAEHDAKAEQGSWPRLNWREITVCLSIILMLIFVLRAVGRFLYLPKQIVMNSKVAVMTKKNKAGHVLRSGDTHLGYWTNDLGYFTNPITTEGLILAHDVFRDEPLRYDDALSLQVVSVVDVPAGKVLMAAMIATKWLPYDPDVQTQPDHVIGHRAKCALHKGTPIITAFVEPQSILFPQVVARSAPGLHAGQILKAEDIDVKRVPKEEGTFTEIQDLIGQRVLEYVEVDKPLMRGQLSRITLRPSTLPEKQKHQAPQRISHD